MKSYPRSLYLPACTALFAACAFGGSITYSATQVLTPAGYNSFQMSGINDSGQVAGYGFLAGTETTAAFIATTTGDTFVAAPDGTSSASAYDINGSGYLVGFFGNGSSQGFIGNGTTSSAIPLPSGVTGNSNAYGINSSGAVAGLGGGVAFTGDSTGTTVIPNPAGMSGIGGEAINDSGYVTGYGAAGGVSQAFIGTGGVNGSSTAVPFATGLTTGRAYAINNSNQVAGYGKNASNQNQAFIGTTSGSTAIPLATGASSATVTYGAINDSGYVVGTSSPGGWVWDQNDGTTLLNSIVPSGWTITSAISINNEGVILARGNESGVGNGLFVELTPITGTPEPGTTGLMIAGGLLCLGAVRRRKTH